MTGLTSCIRTRTHALNLQSFHQTSHASFKMARGRSHKRKTDDGQGRDEEKPNITGPALKKQKRDEDRKDGELPRKKFYRQRAHANPFSDHALT